MLELGLKNLITAQRRRRMLVATDHSKTRHNLEHQYRLLLQDWLSGRRSNDPLLVKQHQEPQRINTRIRTHAHRLFVCLTWQRIGTSCMRNGLAIAV